MAVAGSNVYIATFNGASWAGPGSGVELFYFASATGAPFQIIEARLGQTQYTDADDAETYGMWMACASGAASGGTSVTPVALSETLGSSYASQLTGSYLATTLASGGTTQKKMQDNWNILGQYVYQPPEDARPFVGGNEHFIWRLIPKSGSTRQYSSSLWASIVWEEL